MSPHRTTGHQAAAGNASAMTPTSREGAEKTGREEAPSYARHAVQTWVLRATSASYPSSKVAHIIEDSVVDADALVAGHPAHLPPGRSACPGPAADWCGKTCWPTPRSFGTSPHGPPSRPKPGIDRAASPSGPPPSSLPPCPTDYGTGAPSPQTRSCPWEGPLRDCSDVGTKPIDSPQPIHHPFTQHGVFDTPTHPKDIFQIDSKSLKPVPYRLAQVEPPAVRGPYQCDNSGYSQTRAFCVALSPTTNNFPCSLFSRPLP